MSHTVDLQSGSQIVYPSLECDVVFWSNETNCNASEIIETSRIRFVELHAECPLILCANERGIITVYDFIVKQKVFSMSSNDIYAGILASQQSTSGSNSYTNDSGSSFNDFLHVEEDKGTKKKKGAARNGNSTDNNIVDSSEYYVGDVRKVSFIDRKTMDSLFGASMSASVDYDRFCTDGRILVLCDNYLLLYDIFLHIGSIISVSDGTVKPTCAEFISHSVCVIGCNDGSLRLYSCKELTKAYEIKVLTSHSRSDVIVLKNIPILQRVHDTYVNMNRSSPNMCTINSDVDMLKRRDFRFLSIGLDGQAFVWNGSIVGNIVDIQNSKPYLQLKETNSAFVSKAKHSIIAHSCFMDESTNTLITMSDDRLLRMWELDNTNNTINNSFLSYSSRSNSSSNSNSEKKKSLLRRLMSRKAQGSKPNVLSRERSSTNTSIGGNDHTMNSTTSVPQKRLASIDGDNTINVSCIGKIKAPASYGKLSSCSPSYYFKYSAGTYFICNKGSSISIVQYCNGDGGASEKSSTLEGSTMTGGTDALNATFRMLHDVSISSLLSVKIKATGQQQEVSNSNQGLKVFSVATSRIWPHILVAATNHGLVVLSLQPCQAGPSFGTHPLWGRNYFMYADKVISKVSYDVIDDACVEGECRDSAVPFVCKENSHIIPGDVVDEFSVLGSTTDDNVSLDRAFVNSRPRKSTDFVSETNPRIYSSPSGRYCAFHWSQSLQYIILAVSSNGGAMREVERGYCLHFGWMGAVTDSKSKPSGEDNHTPSTRNSHSDVFSIYTVSYYKDIPIKKKRSTFLVFKKDTDEEKGEYVPSDLIFRSIDTAGATVTLSVTYENLASSLLHQLFGGLLLAMNFNAPASSVKCIFYHLTEDSTTSIDTKTFVLKQIGPSLTGVQFVSWDVMSGYGAVLIDSRVNIVSLRSIDEKYVLQSIASFLLDSIPWLSYYSMWWNRGSLFVSSSSSIYVVCTEYPYSTVRKVSRVQIGKAPIESVTVFSIATQSRTCTNPALVDNLDSPQGLMDSDASYLIKPFGHLEIINVAKNHLIVSNLDGTLFALPLSVCPLATIGVVLAYGDDTAVATYAAGLPASLQELVASMLVQRGLYSKALSLPKISHHLMQEVAWKVRSMDDINTSGLSNPDDKQLMTQLHRVQAQSFHYSNTPCNLGI